MTDTYEPMTDEEIQDYAEALLLKFARRIEPWDIPLQVDQLTPRRLGDIDEVDQGRIQQLLDSAAVSVHWD